MWAQAILRCVASQASCSARASLSSRRTARPGGQTCVLALPPAAVRLSLRLNPSRCLQPIDGELRMWAPERVRGVLCNLPHPAGTHESTDSIVKAAHADMLPFHLGVTALVDSCPEGGGGFTVWPRSHARLFQADSRFGDVVSCADRGGAAGAVGDRVDGACHPELQATYAAVQQSQETLPPLEFHGAEGDVMFWHSHLFHARPENHSNPPQVRQAVIWDCAKRSIDDLHRPRELLEDPWHEWAGCVRAAAVGLTGGEGKL